MGANNAKDAYRIVSVYLRKNAGNENTAKKAINKHRDAIDKLIGIDSGNKYVIAVDMLIKAYYNIEDYVPDGEPMEKLYDYIETFCE